MKRFFLRIIQSKWLILSLIAFYVVVYVLQKAEIISPYIAQLIMLVGINIVMTVSLGMVNGFTGQFSIGHAGFMAIGAYTSVVITTILFKTAASNPILGYLIFFMAAILGGILAAFAGYLLGVPSLRLKGDYLAIVTMAFAEIIRTIIRVSDFLGGPRGIGGIPKYTNFTVVFLFTIIAVWVMRNYIFSTYGRAMMSVRDAEVAAEAMGVNTTKQKILAFVISSFFAGVSGALLVHILQFIHPDNFTFMKSLEYLIYLYIGGSASISGAMVGAAIFTFAPELLRFLKQWRLVVYALVLVLVMIFRNEGIMGVKEFKFIMPKIFKRGEAR